MKIRQSGLVGLVLGLMPAALGYAGPQAGTSGAQSSTQESSLHCDQLPFVENVYWTTDYGPARADVKTSAANFLRCNGPAYALCYYSGPQPMPCKVDKERGIALCECFGYQEPSETYDYSIDINAILNTCAYVESVRDCGHDGVKCAPQVNSAPACQYMNQSPQALWPGADLISAFSTAKAGELGLGCTPCRGVYAGCMTAPCYNRLNEQGETVVICECPLYEGPYQVGRNKARCELGDGLVWSAAYDPDGCGN